MYFMGIDGGGTSLRVVITDEHLNIIAQKQGDSVNPGKIGRDRAASRIQAAIVEMVTEHPVDISACALGIAGAATSHSEQWLIDTLTPALPFSLIVPSSDLEIALVGAHGQRSGLLLLSGTGSAAFGIDRNDNSAMVGGWGYVVDDLGSGYWIGNQALQHTVQAFDGRRHSDALSEKVLKHIGCTSRAEITQWLYQRDDNVVSRIASLSTLILAAADEGIPAALSILDSATAHLEAMVIALRQQLSSRADLPIRFGGGLLQELNPLSSRLCTRLHLTEFPAARVPPVVGAALLAKLHFERST